MSFTQKILFRVFKNDCIIQGLQFKEGPVDKEKD